MKNSDLRYKETHLIPGTSETAFQLGKRKNLA